MPLPKGVRHHNRGVSIVIARLGILCVVCFVKGSAGQGACLLSSEIVLSQHRYSTVAAPPQYRCSFNRGGLR